MICAAVIDASSGTALSMFRGATSMGADGMFGFLQCGIVVDDNVL
jgi:hypothetical protein